jgi:hypothetical protein
MHRRLCIAAIKARRTAPHHQPRCVELGRHIGELELQRLKIGERPAELTAFEQMVARRFEASSGAAERAGRDVEAPAVEPHHRDLKAVAFGAEPIGDRHTAILEDHHRRRLGVPAELFLLLAERQARRTLLDDEAGDPVWPCPAGPHHRHVDVADPAA